MKFESEKEMSIKFKEFILEEFGNNIEIIEEFKGVFGIPDFLVFEKNYEYSDFFVAIELKLKDWKRALIQAFRYRSFANYVLVVLDEYYIDNARRNLSRFYKSNVGLASFNKSGELKIILSSREAEPFSESCRSKMWEKINKTKLFERISENENIISKGNSLRSFLF